MSSTLPGKNFVLGNRAFWLKIEILGLMAVTLGGRNNFEIEAA